MKRLTASLNYDIVVQFRSGFYVVSLLVVGVWVVLMRAVKIDAPVVLPAFMVMSFIITTFFFMGALFLLERLQGTTAALGVTPLRDTEYLLSKVGSLTLLAILENLVVIILGYGFAFDMLPLLLGMMALGVFYTLVGFVVISRYEVFNDYLLPAVGVIMFLMLPLIGQLDLWHTDLFYLHPVQPMLDLLRGVFEPISMGEAIYGVFGSGIWIGLSFGWAKHVYKEAR